MKRGGAPRNATDHNNRHKRPRNNGVEFELPDAQKTFALLRAASALSAIKMF